MDFAGRVLDFEYGYINFKRKTEMICCGGGGDLVLVLTMRNIDAVETERERQ